MISLTPPITGLHIFTCGDIHLLVGIHDLLDHTHDATCCRVLLRSLKPRGRGPARRLYVEVDNWKDQPEDRPLSATSGTKFGFLTTVDATPMRGDADA